MVNELFEHPIIFEEPLKLDGNNTWVQHIPFAFFLVSYLRPEKIVELGVHTGESYFAFCQAVNYLSLKTKCFGIDSWEGDPHTGYYGDSVYQSLLSYQEENYHGISSLLRMQFDHAIQKFENKSIDLLHIDGYHSYDAVKHDFESWLPKVKENGIILFHDTQVREREFGVWKFWEEIKNAYPSFEFEFGYGLGCIVNDKSYGTAPSLLVEKIKNNSDIKMLFEKLGSKNLLLGEILRLKFQLRTDQDEIKYSENSLNKLLRFFGAPSKKTDKI